MGVFQRRPAPRKVLFSQGVSHLVTPQTCDQVTCLGQLLEVEGTNQESGGQGADVRDIGAQGRGAGRAAPQPVVDRGWRMTRWRGAVPDKPRRQGLATEARWAAP